MSTKEENYTYDAIVVGSGITGGWAAKEFCERGLKTLLLERGSPMEHPNYPNTNANSWEFEYANELTAEELEDYPLQSKLWEFKRDQHHFFIKDTEQPYIQKKPFTWFRGNYVGGKSLMWSRNTYRYSDLDFEANLKDGHGIDWPIRYKDIEPWYDYVEKFVGLNGENCGLDHLPDQVLMEPYEMNCIEKHIKKRFEEDLKERYYIQARAAVLTKPHNGRGKCMSRNLCRRGCPYGAYFSSNSSTLPAAMKTGNLTIRPYSIVEKVLLNQDKTKAKGVRVIDKQTGEKIDFFASIISLNASTIGSTAILLNSNKENGGLGNSSGVLGHYLNDHTDTVGSWGMWEGEPDKQYMGTKPNQMYIPRFRNVGDDKQEFLRGYAYECFSWRNTWQKGLYQDGLGADFKNKLTEFGPWESLFLAICESLPNKENKMTLSKDKKDKYGLPLIEIDMQFTDNMKLMRDDAEKSALDMMNACGLKYSSPIREEGVGGETIHEFGTAVMGKDPQESVLNEWNQVHECKNVIVTDGSCLPSSPCQNPSLTYMALTARAVDHICEQMK